MLNQFISQATTLIAGLLLGFALIHAFALKKAALRPASLLRASAH